MIYIESMSAERMKTLQPQSQVHGTVGGISVHGNRNFRSTFKCVYKCFSKMTHYVIEQLSQ